MSKFLKRCLVACLVFALCWGAAIAWWHYRDITPDHVEIALWLAVLPLVALAGLLLLSKSTAEAEAPVAAGTDNGQATARNPDFTIQEFILLAWNHTNRLSESASATLSMLPDAPALDLDPALADSTSFPLMTGRISSIDTDTLRSDLAQNSPIFATAQLDDSVLRAVAILKDTCAPILPQVHTIAEQAQQPKWVEHLHIACINPPDWPDEAIAYLHSEITTWTRHAGLPNIHIHATSTPGRHPIEQRFPLRTSQEEQHPEQRGLTLILACASDISTQAVRRLDTLGMLYSSHTPKQGLPPGEGAAAILVMHAQQPDLQRYLQQTPESAPAYVRLLLPASANSHSGQIHLPTDTALPQLLDAADIDAKDIAYIAAHGDQSKRTLQQILTVQRQFFPDLDPETSLVLTGPVLGTLGCTSLWHQSVLAAEKTRQTQLPSYIYATHQTDINIGLVAPLHVISS